jgi:hypothetical protein
MYFSLFHLTCLLSPFILGEKITTSKFQQQFDVNNLHISKIWQQFNSNSTEIKLLIAFLLAFLFKNTLKITTEVSWLARTTTFHQRRAQRGRKIIPRLKNRGRVCISRQPKTSEPSDMWTWRDGEKEREM